MRSISGDFIFRPAGNELKFVGDFDGLYRFDSNPWHQGEDPNVPEDAQSYYNISRRRLVEAVREHVELGWIGGLEVGCGLGQVVHQLSCIHNVKFWDGCDISPVALAKAREFYPQHDFFVYDITQPMVPHRSYHVVVLGQIFWYILHELEVALSNCHLMLRPGGYLIVSQAFMPKNEQRYGTGVARGFGGVVRALLKHEDLFKLVDASFLELPTLSHSDGLVVLRKV